MKKLLWTIAAVLASGGCFYAMHIDLKQISNNTFEVFELARKGTAEELKAFLHAHADTDLNKPITDFFQGYTPLHFACLQGNVETGRTLIEHGSSVAGIAGQEPTPLMLAAAVGSEPLCRMILEKDSALKNSDQALKAMKRAVSEGHAPLVGFFIDEEIVCDLQEMLSLAAESGQQDLADLFVAHGAKIGNDPKLVFAAVQGGLIEIVQKLLDAGTPVNSRNFEGCSLLNRANDCLNSPSKADRKEQLSAICNVLIDRGGIDDVILPAPITQVTRFRYDVTALSNMMRAFNLYRVIIDTCCCKKKKNE